MNLDQMHDFQINENNFKHRLSIDIARYFKKLFSTLKIEQSVHINSSTVNIMDIFIHNVMA